MHTKIFMHCSILLGEIAYTYHKIREAGKIKVLARGKGFSGWQGAACGCWSGGYCSSRVKLKSERTILMKHFFLAISVLASSASVAAGIIYWKEISREFESAKTKAEFLVLQQKYPQEFGGYDPDRVESASITVFNYELRGDTTCPKDDPRAHFRAISSSICFAGTNGGPGMCSATAFPYPGFVQNDPCAQ
jgi:hypothetical protein